MTSQNKNQLRIEGTVAPGFESVRQLYVHNMESLEERNTQLCVYHKGERVVDLWASAIGDDTFSPDSLVNIFSSGKSLAALAMASLVDQGHLGYNEKISTYWPEFAANGKEDLIVADLMRHEAGLAAFNTSLPPEDLHTENIKKNLVGSVIEAQPSRFPKPPASRREYHAITRGWVANEIFRRADPAGRTIGEFLREDVSGPLEVDAMIGVREEDLPRISPVVPLGFSIHVSGESQAALFGTADRAEHLPTNRKTGAHHCRCATCDRGKRSAALQGYDGSRQFQRSRGRHGRDAVC